MAQFFIRRPIVAMVIAIVTVVVGLVTPVTTTYCRVPPGEPYTYRSHHDLSRRGRGSGDGFRCDAHRVKGQWSRQNAVPAVIQRE